MESLASWDRFMALNRNEPPLIFSSGFRHDVNVGPCCTTHSHRGIEIVYHPSGRGVTRLEKGARVSFAEGSVVIYAPGERHDQIMTGAGVDFCVQLGIPKSYRSVPHQCFSIPQVTDPMIIEDLRLLSQGHVAPTAPEQAIFNLRGTSTLHALVNYAREGHEEHGGGAEQYVQRAEQFVREHFDSPSAVRDAAEFAGISYDHLRHVVHAKRGRSLVRYLGEVRIDRAKTLLVNSRLPLKQIATQCGFRDEYYFSAVFRRLAGCPPGRYREKRSTRL